MDHPGAGAFDLGAEERPRVLLLHGLTGAPSELWPLGQALACLGHRVEAPLLPGHGASPAALARVDAEEMLEAARRHARGADVVVGMSMGALLALAVAPECAPRALVLLAPAVVMTGRTRLFDLLGRVPWPRSSVLVPKGAPDAGSPEPVAGPGLVPEAERVARAAQSRPGADGRYDRVPLHWSHELRRLRRIARSAAERITAPTLVLHGAEDRTASAESAVEVARWLWCAPVRVTVLPRSPHLLLLGPERATVAGEVASFLGEHAPPVAWPESA